MVDFCKQPATVRYAFQLKRRHLEWRTTLPSDVTNNAKTMIRRISKMRKTKTNKI